MNVLKSKKVLALGVLAVVGAVDYFAGTDLLPASP